jgi:hypothetical protein
MVTQGLSIQLVTLVDWILVSLLQCLPRLISVSLIAFVDTLMTRAFVNWQLHAAVIRR